MRHVPRWLYLLTVGGLVTTPAVAQDVSRDRLAGTWLNVRTTTLGDRRNENVIVREEFLTLNADGTWRRRLMENGVDAPPGAGSPWDASLPREGRWYLVADSLWFSNPDSASADTPPAPGVGKARLVNRRLDARKVSLQDQRLVLGFFSDDDWKAPLSCQDQIFQRVDASKPIQSTWQSEPPATLKRADLVGTWTMASQMTPKQTDTLTLRADSTWTWTWVPGPTTPPNGRHSISGQWYVLRGDRIWLTDTLPQHQSTWFGVGKITLGNGVFTMASDQPATCADASGTTYTRVP